MEPALLEPIFSRWEEKWHASGGKDINNPKIPASFALDSGTFVYGNVPDLKVRKTKVEAQPIAHFQADDGDKISKD